MVVLQEKNKQAQEDLIGYVPFYPEKDTFERYQKQYPNLSISCQFPKLEVRLQIEIKNLSFIAACEGLSIGKREE